jgi:hypothetical protein
MLSKMTSRCMYAFEAKTPALRVLLEELGAVWRAPPAAVDWLPASSTAVQIRCWTRSLRSSARTWWSCASMWARMKGVTSAPSVERLAEAVEGPVVVGAVASPPLLQRGELGQLEPAAVHRERGDDPGHAPVPVPERVDGGAREDPVDLLDRDRDALHRGGGGHRFRLQVAPETPRPGPPGILDAREAPS